MRKTGSQDRAAPGAPLPPRTSAAPVHDLAQLPRTTLQAMAEAGHQALDCHRVLSKTGDNVVGELLRGQGTFYEWTHYPEGDVYDFESHAQYYYHAHPRDQRPGEHGHFHTFLRPAGMARGVRPARIPGNRVPADAKLALSHLVAISMSERGTATQLFTTNRWVTDETFYPGTDVIAMLDRFAIDLARPSWLINRWISSMLRLFRPQIEALLVERDRAVADWQRRHPKLEVLEDRRLEVTSTLDISVEDQLQRVAAALKRARR
jgi:hypothetical protein